MVSHEPAEPQDGTTEPSVFVLSAVVYQVWHVQLLPLC